MMSLKRVKKFEGMVEYPIQYLTIPARDTSMDHLPKVLRPWNKMEIKAYASTIMYEIGFYWVKCET